MLKNLPKMHGRQTRKGSMKVGPDPTQVAGSSADFDFKSKERLGRVRKGMGSDSSVNAVQENDCTEG